MRFVRAGDKQEAPEGDVGNERKVRAGSELQPVCLLSAVSPASSMTIIVEDEAMYKP